MHIFIYMYIYIYYIYIVVDEFLSVDETENIITGINQGVDLLQTCKSCAVGKIVAASGTSCERPINQMSVTDTSPCICNLGYTGVDGGPCTICDVNTYKDFLGDTVCQACPLDTVSLTGSTSLAACTPRPCNAGFESIAGGPCAACASSKYTLGAGVTCANPPANAFTANTLSFLCNAGYSTPVVANACSACGTGKYKETSGNDVLDCLDCKQFSKSPASTISAAGCLCVQGHAAQGSALDTCVECAKGKYKAASANAACMDCPAGSKTLLARAFDIVYCVANVGFHKVSGAFQACPVGSFKPQEGDVACTTCPTYTTTLAAGSVASSLCVCVAPKCQAFGSACGCAPGFSYVGASQTCEPCPAGSFCLGTQAGGSLVTTTATPCPANSDSSVGAVSQAACASSPATRAPTPRARCASRARLRQPRGPCPAALAPRTRRRGRGARHPRPVRACQATQAARADRVRSARPVRTRLAARVSCVLLTRPRRLARVRPLHTSATKGTKQLAGPARRAPLERTGSKVPGSTFSPETDPSLPPSRPTGTRRRRNSTACARVRRAWATRGLSPLALSLLVLLQATARARLWHLLKALQILK